MRVQSLFLLLAAGVAGGVLGCDEVSFPTPAPDEEFQATLSGANEPTPVTAPGSGTARFAVTLDTFLSFRMEVAAIDSPTVAHIHEGAAGVPGGVIVTLYSGPTRGLAYAGVLGQNQFKPSQLTQLPAGFGATPQARFDSLLVLMRTGGVYVNVHSRSNPGGHMRGQIQPQ
ncbi:MAG TPA: CHRD domain-containing protein [Gemmatimonadales bacterium]|nr:CHRD domain-containing protein [Gemmatimonadales bacterium]